MHVLDFLSSVFMPHSRMMLAMHGCSSIHLLSFEFWSLLHAYVEVFPYFGTIVHHISELTCMPYSHVFHSLNVLESRA